MSGFSDLWAEVAAPLLTEQFAGEALCTPAGLAQRTVTTIIWPEEVTEEQTARGIKRKHVRRLSVPRTAVAANGGPFLASPGIRDVWSVDGVVYSVDAIESQTDTETVLRLLRVTAHEETKEGLRRRR
jgi:hypothetical protein